MSMNIESQETPAEYKDKSQLIFVGEFWSDSPAYKEWVEGRIEIRKWEDNYSNEEVRYCTPKTDEWWAFQEKYNGKWLTNDELKKFIDVVQKKFHKKPKKS